MPEQVAVEASWLDLVSLVIIVTLAVAGVIKGAIRIVVGLAALTGGVLLAMRYAPALGAEGWPVIA